MTSKNATCHRLACYTSNAGPITFETASKFIRLVAIGLKAEVDWSSLIPKAECTGKNLSKSESEDYLVYSFFDFISLIWLSLYPAEILGHVIHRPSPGLHSAPCKKTVFFSQRLF